jgi:hypothetical protein
MESGPTLAIVGAPIYIQIFEKGIFTVTSILRELKLSHYDYLNQVLFPAI